MDLQGPLSGVATIETIDWILTKGLGWCEVA